MHGGVLTVDHVHVIGLDMNSSLRNGEAKQTTDASRQSDLKAVFRRYLRCSHQDCIGLSLEAGHYRSWPLLLCRRHCYSNHTGSRESEDTGSSSP